MFPTFLYFPGQDCCHQLAIYRRLTPLCATWAVQAPALHPSWPTLYWCRHSWPGHAAVAYHVQPEFSLCLEDVKIEHQAPYWLYRGYPDGDAYDCRGLWLGNSGWPHWSASDCTRDREPLPMLPTNGLMPAAYVHTPCRAWGSAPNGTGRQRRRQA